LLRTIRLLRGQGKAKSKKTENGRKCAPDHERIHSQNAPSASEILRGFFPLMIAQRF
jgi:hypothetical protein